MDVQRFAHYEITRLIGAGGMGEVYLARDTQLGRDVALKFLPDAFAADADRLARFEREAKLLASLNHPNIAAIYGFAQDGKRRALALEYVEGPDLSERLASGPLPVDEAVDVARQVAEAVEEAHAHEVIHRDLKPGNVKVAPGGRVKVLDFGLAKALAPSENPAEAGPEDLTQSPTVMSSPTVRGVILGTAAYMAPEQARGKVVDKRADIWAFGCLLYEMLTGKQAFAGETLTDTLAAVIKSDPDWSALPAGTPRAVRRLLRRCLVKTPRDRLRDIGEARVVLAHAFDADPDDAVAPAGPAPVRRGPGARAFVVTVVAVAAIAAAVAWWVKPAATPGRSAAGAFHVSLSQVTNLPGIERDPCLSPNGRQILYVADAAGNADIYLQRVGGFNAINLTKDYKGDDVTPAWSPDGEQIAFASDREGGGIFVMGATGESPRRISDAGYDPAWSPDGSKILYTTEHVLTPYDRGSTSSIWVVDIASGGKATKLYDGDAVQGQWSPSGARIAFWSAAGGQRDIQTVSADGRDTTFVTRDAPTDWSPQWSRDGRWLFFVSDRSGYPNVFRVRIDERTGRTHGVPEMVTAGTTMIGSISAGAGGRIAYTTVTQSGTVERRSMDPRTLTVGDKTSVMLRAAAPLTQYDISPDGEWLTYRTSLPQEDIYIVRLDGTQRRQLTDDVARDRGPKWSPDGREIAFYSNRGGDYQIWVIHPDGTNLHPLTQDPRQIAVIVFAPDGRRAAFAFGFGSREWSLGALDTIPVTHFTPMPEPPLPDGWFVPMSWSHDGARILGYGVATDRSKMSPCIYDVAHGTYDIVTDANGHALGGSSGAAMAKWLSDDRRFVFSDDRLSELRLYDSASRTTKPVIHVDNTNSSVAISPDWRTIVVGKFPTSSDIWMATLK